MKQNFTIIIFLSFVIVSFAQVKLSLPQILAYKNDIVPVYVSITTTDSISTLQFSLNWDAKVLSFVNVDSLILPISNGENFGTNNAANGSLSFLWIAPKLPYFFSKPTNLFKIQFKVIGEGGTNSVIQFVDVPTKTQSKNPQNVSLTVEKTDGSASSKIRVSTLNANIQEKFVIGQNYPNPSNGDLNIPIEVKNSSEYTLTIRDIYGKTQLSDKNKLIEGKTEWHLPFSTSGLFIYSLCNEKGECASKKFLSN